MAAFTPFEPAVEKGNAGLTQVVSIGAGAATSQTINIASSVGNSNNSLLATFANATAGTVAYVRISTESSTSIAATSTDTPMVSSGAGFPEVRLFASPNPTGSYNIAVIVTATPATAGSIWFTPGQGAVGT
jgi:hypothetical protein